MTRPSELLLRFGSALIVVTCLTCESAFGESGPLVTADAQVANIRRALITAGDPDSLAAAALVNGTFLMPGALTSYIVVDEERLELIHRAANLAPNRYDLAWVELQLCRAAKSCDLKPIAARLQALDPRNAASWIGELPTKKSGTDDARSDATIRRMAGCDRFDTQWAPTVLHLATAIDRTKTLEEASAVALSAGITAALSMPQYADVSSACSGETLRQPHRLTACKSLATVMRRGDTYEAELLGVAISKRVWPKVSVSYRDAVKAARRAHYRMAAVSDAGRNHLWDDAYARLYLGWLASNKTEQDVYRAELVAAGFDPEAPPYYLEPVNERE